MGSSSKHVLVDAEGLLSLLVIGGETVLNST